MKKTDRIYVAGHRGMVGSAVVRQLQQGGWTDIITRGRDELDLRNAPAVEAFFGTEHPDMVVLAAAKVGGIKANNTYPAEFLHDNLAIQTNVIHQAWKSGVKKLCFLGSSCIYPRECPQPIKEEYLLTGPLEPTNEAYALAKITGHKMAYFYSTQYGFNTISLMPCNLYGTNDCFDLEKSHVLSALVKRFVDAVDEGASQVTLWGSGSATREFLHVDDLARAVVFLMQSWESPELINVGYGEELSIRELALKIKDLTGFSGEIAWDTSKPDGMPRKCMDIGKLSALGFKPQITLEEGLKQTIREYRELKTR